MPRSFTFATIADYRAAKGNNGAIYAELVPSGIKSGSCVSKITATGDVFIDSINPFVTPELGQEGDTLYYSSTEGYRFLRAGNTTWDDQSYGQVFIDLAKIPSGFSVVAPYTDIFNYKQTDENIGSGKASMTKILGNSLAWNQLCANGDFVNTNGWSCESGSIAVNNNTLVFTPSSTDTSVVFTDNTKRDYHKMYFGLYVKTENAASCMISDRYGSNYSSTYLSVPANTWVRYTSIVSLAGSGSYKNIGPFRLRVKAGSGVVNIKKWIVVDLTLMFGEGKEPATAAEFEALFPLPYYANNPGQLLSNKAKAIEFVGFNQWDEEWEIGALNIQNGEKDNTSTNQIRSKNYIPILPGKYYYAILSVKRLCFYDKNKNFIESAADASSNFVFQTPANAYYMKFYNASAYGTTYNHDICINLSGKRNGQYEPYKKVVLPLPNLDQIKVYSHNLYNPATGKAKVEGGKQYYIGGTYTSISQNGTVITVSSHLFTPPASGDVDVVGGNSTDTIINLSSSFNGQYEPHGILTMTGGLKSAGSVRDEIVGNKFVKKVGRVDLGDLTWSASYSGSFGSPVSGAKGSGSSSMASNLICGKYTNDYVNRITTSSHIDKTIGINGGGETIYAYDTAYSDAATFKTAMQNEHVQLDYELATPIEYEIYSPTKMPFNWKYRVSEYHTKKMLPENGENPTSAPFACEIKQI